MESYQHSLLFGVVLVTAFLVVMNIPSASLPNIPHVALGSYYDDFDTASMLFVGDVMLGRAVERRVNTEGLPYPFAGIGRLVESVQVAVLNFEGVVPKTHKETPNGSFVFSIKEEFIEEIQKTGFDVLGFANNHAYDHGKVALSHTKELCVNAKLFCIGDPGTGGTSSVVMSVGSAEVGIIALNATSGMPNNEDIASLFSELERESDLQVVFIHWGEEYELIHNKAQETFAHFVIDLGVDAVIGHHPHVVQDIEIYKNKPIFYSLGNFIFDQFIDDHTEQGLAVRMDISRHEASYVLIPVSSLGTPSQPHIMKVDDSEVFMNELMDRSDDTNHYRVGNAIGPFPW